MNLLAGNYTIEANGVDEIVAGYLDELVAKELKKVDESLVCNITINQQNNKFTIVYTSSVGDGELSTENIYDDLENMVVVMVSDLQQKWNEQHPVTVESPTINPMVEFDKAQEPIAETNSKAVQQSSHSTPAVQTYSKTVVTAEEPQKKTGEKIKQAFVTFGQAFKNFGQTFKKSNDTNSSDVYVNNAPTGSVGTLKKFSDGTSGIIIYATEDLAHGVVVSINEYELFWEGVRKRCGHDIPSLPNIENEDIAKQQNFADGMTYTSIILQSIGQYAAPAAAWCAQLGEGWYLPSAGELWYLFSIANSEAEEDGPISQSLKRYNGMPFSGGWYWSSTEYNATEAYNVSASGSIATEDKSNTNMVRAFRVY